MARAVLVRNMLGEGKKVGGGKSRESLKRNAGRRDKREEKTEIPFKRNARKRERE